MNKDISNIDKYIQKSKKRFQDDPINNFKDLLIVCQDSIELIDFIRLKDYFLSITENMREIPPSVSLI